MKKSIRFGVFVFMGMIVPTILFAGKKSEFNFSSGFIENKGQIVDQNNLPNRRVKYLLINEVSGLQVQLRVDGFSYQITGSLSPALSPSTKAQDKLGEGEDSRSKSGVQGSALNTHRIDIDFENSLPNIQLQASEPEEGSFNYYTGGNEEGITGVKQYRKIIYKQVWQGIDVVFTVNDKTQKVEYDFVLQSGAKLEDIKLKIKGAGSVKENNRSLMIKTACGTISEQIPLSYQEIEGKRIKRNMKWKKLGNDLWSFKGSWDKGTILVIDPTPDLIWGTYIGGSSPSIEQGNAISADHFGNVYVTGTIRANGNVATAGAYQPAFGGGGGPDAFLAKFDSSGTLLWGTYFGKTGTEVGNGVCSDNNQNVYLTGHTNSSGMATVGAQQFSFAGGKDAFIAKFNSSGAIQWCTYYGGANDDEANAIVTDGNAFLYVVGNTDSPTGIATNGAFKSFIDDGDPDAFLVKFDLSGALQWGTYFGGGSYLTDFGSGVALDASGNTFITGASTGFIATAGAYQTVGGGGWDAYIAKFNPTGALIWGTYFGGPGHENGSLALGGGITVDNNNVYITGNTGSATGIATSGTWKTFLDGVGDAFLAKFDTAGAFQWGTYYGGSGNENYSYLTSDGNNNIYLTGQTQSIGAGIATSDAYQTDNAGGGGNDAFIAKFDANGMLQYGTYYGGPTGDNGNAIASDGCSNVYITGRAAAGIATSGGYQNTFGGGTSDIFVARFGISSAIVTPTITASGSTTFCQGGSVTLDAGNAYTTYSWLPGGATTQSINSSASNTYTLTVTKTCEAGIGESTIAIKVNPLPTIITSSTAISICYGESNFTISVSGTTSYSWFPSLGLSATTGSTVETSVVAIAPALYSYTIIGTDANSCSSTQTIMVHVLSLPTINATPALSVCYGSSTLLSASISSGTFKWSNNSTTSTISITPTFSITYAIFGEDENGCTAKIFIPITVLALPTAYAGTNQYMCLASNPITLLGSGGVNYSWSPANFLNVTNSVSVLCSPTLIGVYDYLLTVTDAYNCIDEDTVTVIVTDSLIANAGIDTTICTGFPLTLKGLGGSTINWSPASGLSNDTIGNPVFNFNNNAGTYSYTLTVVAQGCYPHSDGITIQVLQSPQLITSNVSICIGTTPTLTVSGADHYQWQPTGDTTSILSPSLLLSTQYTVLGTNNNGCADTNIVQITVHNLPPVDAGSNITASTSLKLNLQGSGASVYFWSPAANLSQNDIPNPEIKTRITQQYHLIGTDNNGCENRDSVYIKYITCDELFVPEAFSPNNDQQNDYLEIKVEDSQCIQTLNIQIYDRWGTKVFETTNPETKWDGKYLGKELTDAVFVYRIDITNVDNKEITQKGNVSLVR